VLLLRDVRRRFVVVVVVGGEEKKEAGVATASPRRAEVE
jgi:hypothetical protein